MSPGYELEQWNELGEQKLTSDKLELGLAVVAGMQELHLMGRSFLLTGLATVGASPDDLPWEPALQPLAWILLNGATTDSRSVSISVDCTAAWSCTAPMSFPAA